MYKYAYQDLTWLKFVCIRARSVCNANNDVTDKKYYILVFFHIFLRLRHGCQCNWLLGISHGVCNRYYRTNRHTVRSCTRRKDWNVLIGESTLGNRLMPQDDGSTLRDVRSTIFIRVYNWRNSYRPCAHKGAHKYAKLLFDRRDDCDESHNVTWI